MAGYLFRRLRSDDIAAAGRFAAALAACQLARSGAFTGAEDEVRALLDAATSGQVSPGAPMRANHLGKRTT